MYSAVHVESVCESATNKTKIPEKKPNELRHLYISHNLFCFWRWIQKARTKTFLKKSVGFINRSKKSSQIFSNKKPLIAKINRCFKNLIDLANTTTTFLGQLLVSLLNAKCYKKFPMLEWSDKSHAFVGKSVWRK